MISAPLGDFRHTMHIGRGGDTFGDTSFLSTVGPSQSSQDTETSVPSPTVEPEVAVVDNLYENELHSESMSSFTLDLDLDLGPSMLGDVLGVMDGLGMDDVFSPKTSVSPVEINQGNSAMERSVDLKNELNGKNSVDRCESLEGDRRLPDGNGLKPKGLRPKVRFSDKREEIIRQASEEEEAQGFDFQDEDLVVCHSPTQGDSERATGVILSGGETEFTNNKVELPPSPASSHSSEYEGVTPLDSRRVEICHSETDSEEEEEEAGKGYTFEDEFDDEIGL